MAALALLGCGCSETELAMHTLKQVNESYEKAPAPEYKIGQPYKIDGVWYYPAENYHYVETGIASWYGPNFHGRTTANGELFDQNALTAAHRTLPLPSIVRVTNLRNGRSIKVRINDRGPFARGRIIDMSRRGAQLLGFLNEGTAPVKVEIVADESRQIALAAQRQAGAAPPRVVQVATLPGEGQPQVGQEPETTTVPIPPPSAADGTAAPPVVTTVPPTHQPLLYIQAGAFTQQAGATRTVRALSSVGHARAVKAIVGDRLFWRVRVGPMRTVEEGDRMLGRVVRAGFPEARIVVD